MKKVVTALKTAPPPPAVEKRLMTMAEAGIYLSRPKRAMEALAAKGKVPTVKHDDRRFFDRHDLDRWIQEGKNGHGELKLHILPPTNGS